MLGFFVFYKRSNKSDVILLLQPLEQVQAEPAPSGMHKYLSGEQLVPPPKNIAVNKQNLLLLQRLSSPPLPCLHLSSLEPRGQQLCVTGTSGSNGERVLQPIVQAELSLRIDVGCSCWQSVAAV